MTSVNERGLTLIELLIALSIMGLIAGGGVALLSTAIDAYSRGNSKASLYREGLLIMERMTSGVRECTALFIPNNHKNTRNTLAYSGGYNNDGDYYFNDPLFPRIDEDTSADMNRDSSPGLFQIDDNGDGVVDSTGAGNDDEDLSSDEDPLDGLDNDGDGNIDEDFTLDNTNDNTAGIKGMDDDGDGSIDEGNLLDDDEDGSSDEDRYNAIVYSRLSGTNTLQVWDSVSVQTKVLSTRVSSFQCTYFTFTASALVKVKIELTLAGDNGESVTFSEYVFPRNVHQKTGKRVR